MAGVVALREFEPLARARLYAASADYIGGGSWDEQTLAENPLSEIAALRAENAALKAGKPSNGGNPGNEPPAGRGAPVQDGPSHKEMFTNYGKRLPSSAEIDRITALQRASW